MVRRLLTQNIQTCRQDRRAEREPTPPLRVHDDRAAVVVAAEIQTVEAHEAARRARRLDVRRVLEADAAREEEVEEEEVPLGPNEVRIDEYDKVTCCSCEARLGVPEGSEPPFRFTCPKCETRIRVVE